MHKYRIILSANTTWYLYNFRLPLIKELLKRGYKVYILSPEDKYVGLLEKMNISHIDIKINRSGINPLEDILLLAKFVQIYKKYKPDIVQHFTVKPVIYGTIAARITNIRYIYNMITGLGYVFTAVSFKKRFVQFITRLMYKKVLKYSTHIFFQNKEDCNYFFKHKLVQLEKTSIVPGTGVDLEKFSPVVKNNRKEITFIFSGRLLWDKGVGDFVEAARRLKQKYKNIHFWVAGPVDLQNPRGIPPEQLNQWSREGIIKYLGMTDNIKQYLHNADVIVLPSYYREGIPLSLLEGAACGLPIITTDSYGCREVVIEGKNGYLVPIKNVDALVNAMGNFIENPELINEMGRASRKIAEEKFDSKKIVHMILQKYPF
uniref:Glycosyltransferase family 1 protein n=1 Tax=candidate division WOR-3 bacterium TaxID=2052148 RepID=A0A7V1EIM6_UNCW3